jgi:hypothetical protein
MAAGIVEPLGLRNVLLPNLRNGLFAYLALSRNGGRSNRLSSGAL